MQPTQMQDVTRNDEVLAVSLELASKSWKVGLDDGRRKAPAVHGVDHGEPKGRLEEAIAVIDFLDFHAAGYHWPAFNVADSAITCGAALLVWDSLRPGKSARS